MNYSWPGNFRELENVIYRALKNLRLSGKRQLEFSHIDRFFNPEESLETEKPKSLQKQKTYDECLEHFEKNYFGYLNEAYSGNETKISQISERGRGFVRSRLKKYGLKNN